MMRAELPHRENGVELAEGPTAPRRSIPQKLCQHWEGWGGGSPGIQAMWPSELENCAAPGRGRKSFPGQKCLFITRTLLEIVQNVAVCRSETSPQHVPPVTQPWERILLPAGGGSRAEAHPGNVPPRQGSLLALLLPQKTCTSPSLSSCRKRS